ncbi:MAG: manganese efflux pump [Methanomassiliicoccales archaeon]|nr:MAG: manganese efflux pump [Methanomassiliicoccales archaeon]
MDILTVLLIATGLAMDAFAVSIVKGMTVRNRRMRTGMVLASLFGGFQAMMPILGWTAGQGFKEFIMGIDHWVAFLLLGFIGIKMIYDSWDGDEDGDGDVTLTMAILLAIATSIDSLMVGLSFAFLETSILLPAIIIGTVTFGFCAAGFVFGGKLGVMVGRGVKMIGGLILILIGIRILIEHIW